MEDTRSLGDVMYTQLLDKFFKFTQLIDEGEQSIGQLSTCMNAYNVPFTRG